MENSDSTASPTAPEDDAPHLLVVDDDTRIRNLLKQYLSENGFRITVAGNADEAPRFTRGYGLVFGYNERKAMSMALTDRAMRAAELGEAADAPANDIEFMLYHSDNVEASGFVQHLKLPHYVDFQANLELLRRLRGEQEGTDATAAQPASHPQPQPQEETLA